MDRFAAEAYQAQMDLADRVQRGGAMWFMEEQPGQTATPAELATSFARFLRIVPTYAVAADACTYLCDAVDRWSPQALLPTDLPGDRGFLYPHNPFMVRGRDAADVDRAVCALDSITWVRHPGALSGGGGNPGEPPTDGIMLFALLNAYSGEIDLPVRTPPALLTVMVPFGSAEQLWVTLYMPPGVTADEEALRDTSRQVAALLAVFWAFVQQEVIVRGADQADRPTRRRAQRADLPPPSICVVDLPRRRYTHAPHEAGAEPTRTFSHRWVVHGFFRNQWYPSVKAHRQKWIAEYIKGPEDKPLASKRIVYRVRTVERSPG